MTESHGADPPADPPVAPPRPMWAVEPEVGLPVAPPVTPPRRRRRWLRELPFVVIGIVVVGTIVTCGITQLFGDDESPDPAAGAIGDCFHIGTPGLELPPDDDDLSYPVRCDQPHHYETYYRGRLSGPDADAVSPDLARTSARVRQLCDAAVEPFLGGPYSDARVITDVIMPTDRGWAAGDRWFNCVLGETGDVLGRFVRRTDTLRDGLRGDRPLAVGCVDVVAIDGKIERIDYARCATAHSGEFVGAHAIEDTDAYPDDETADAIAGPACVRLAAAFLGLTEQEFEAREDIGYTWIMADEEGWRIGDRSVRCLVTTRDYKRVVTGSVKGLGPSRLPGA